VFAGIGPLLVNDLASVDAVLQHQVKGAAGEWLTASEGDGGALAQQLLVRPWSSSSSYDAADSGMGGQISAFNSPPVPA